MLQITELKDVSIIEMLHKNLGFKSIELVSKISNLRLTTDKLLNSLKFYKDDNFFIFANSRDNFRAEYDIGTGILNVKQDFNIQDELNEEYLIDNMNKMSEWINFILKNTE